jgi:4-hydroxy-tetrahydrodipicolinate synthase
VGNVTTHARQRLRGASAALTTPFDATGSVDWTRLAGHAAALLSKGVATVAAFGTTGEGVSIPLAVRAELAERFAGHGIDLARVVACVFAVSAEDAGDEIAAALRSGQAAVLLSPPFYFKDLSPDGLFQWFATAFERAGADGRDIVLYNIPQLTGVRIDTDLVARLREKFGPVVAGVKDSGGDWKHTAALIGDHGDLAILVGHEGHLARAVRLGASGAISGIANITPGLVARLASGEDDPRIDRILDHVLALPVVPAIKALQALLLNDTTWRAVRPPLVELDRRTADLTWGDISELLND